MLVCSSKEENSTIMVSSTEIIVKSSSRRFVLALIGLSGRHTCSQSAFHAVSRPVHPTPQEAAACAKGTKGLSTPSGCNDSTVSELRTLPSIRVPICFFAQRGCRSAHVLRGPSGRSCSRSTNAGARHAKRCTCPRYAAHAAHAGYAGHASHGWPPNWCTPPRICSSTRICTSSWLCPTPNGRHTGGLSTKLGSCHCTTRDFSHCNHWNYCRGD